MDINELESYNLSDAVKFHQQLNPVLWGPDEHLLPPVRQALLKIADDFREFLGVDDLTIQDVTVSGSNAAYSYTDHSDIDLHLVVNRPDDPVYRELFDAKKYQYNDEHNIRIGPYDVELYVQDAAEPHVSQGIYSVRDGEWLSVPRRRRAAANDISVQSKYEDLGRRAESAIESGNLKRIRTVIDTIKNIRRAGLAQHGEFGSENLAYKLLRNQGLIEKLYAARTAAEDQDLSLVERRKKKKSKPRKRWTWGGYWAPGFAFGSSDAAGDASGDGGGGGESMYESAAARGWQRLAMPEYDFPVYVKFLPGQAIISVEDMDVQGENPGRFSLSFQAQLETGRMVAAHGDWNRNQPFDLDMMDSGVLEEIVAEVLDAVRRRWGHSAQTIQDELEGGISLGLGETSTPNGVSASTRMFLSETNTDDIVKQFIKDTAKRLGIERMPRVFFHRTDAWSKQRHSFGMYDPQQHELHVSLPNRHLLDILRTTAHELAHCRQHEIKPLPADAGRTGSPFEDEAHAVAGEIMRDFADSHPDLFGEELREDIMGVIPAGTRRIIAGMCAAAGLSGCVTTADLRTVQTLGRAAQSMERYGVEGAQEEVTQEIKNYLRARQGDANAQNQSHIYRHERQQQATPRDAATRPLPGRILSREPQNESASGYIPTGKQARDPRFSTALTQDVRPGEVQRQARKMGFETTAGGVPPLLVQDLQNALSEFKTTGTVQERCWTGYRQAGMKRRGRRQVPNCVPVSEGMGVPPVGPVLPMPRDLPRRQPPWPSPEERRRKKNAEPLTEVNMSPSALKTFAETNPAAQNITAGFELELCFSGIGTGSYGIQDEGVRDIYDIDDLRDLFRDHVSRRDPGYARMDNDYMEAWYDRINDWIDSYGRVEDRARDLAGQDLGRSEIQDRADSLLALADDEDADPDEYFAQAEEQLVDETWESFQDAAREELEEEARDEIDFSFNDWLRRNYSSLSSLAWDYDLAVPFVDDDGEAFSESDMEQAAAYLEEETGLQVRVSGSYHGVRRGPYIIIEPDSSIQPDSGDAGAEVVTPPLPLPQTLKLFGEVVAWAKSQGGYTNGSTGLHFNISSPDMERFDYLKMALLLGDEYLLKQFGRLYNSYTRSALDKIRASLYGDSTNTRAMQIMQSLRDHTHATAQQLMTEWFRNPRGISDKYTSLHWTGDYMEVRSLGGQDVLAHPDQALQGIYRIVRVWASAIDPELDRQDYLKKLYQMSEKALSQKTAPAGQQVALGEVLARYIAGDKAAAQELLQKFRQQRPGKKPLDQTAAGTAPGIRPTTPQPTGFGDFTGRWLIRANGQVVHAISGIGNVQADANRHALRWLIDNGYREGTEIEVVPEFA